MQNSTTPLPTRRHALMTWALAGLLATGLTALSASGAAAASKSSSSHSSSRPSQATIRKDLAAYDSCLAKHGVKLPKRPSGSHGFGSGNFHPPSGGFPSGGFGGSHGSFPGGGFPGAFGSTSKNSKFAKAQKDCKSKLPKGFSGFGGFGRPGGGTFKPTAAQQAAITKLDQCLDAHGMKVASNANFETLRSLLSTPAAKACQSDLSGVFGHPPTGTSGAGSGSGTSH